MSSSIREILINSHSIPKIINALLLIPLLLSLLPYFFLQYSSAHQFYSIGAQLLTEILSNKTLLDSNPCLRFSQARIHIKFESCSENAVPFPAAFPNTTTSTRFARGHYRALPRPGYFHGSWLRGRRDPFVIYRGFARYATPPSSTGEQWKLPRETIPDSLSLCSCTRVIACWSSVKADKSFFVRFLRSVPWRNYFTDGRRLSSTFSSLAAFHFVLSRAMTLVSPLFF